MWNFSLYNCYAKVSFGTWIEWIDRREFHTTAIGFGHRQHSLKQKTDHSLPRQMEVMSTSNSKGKFLLIPMGSRFYLGFLIISWWVLYMWILPAKVRSLTQATQHWKTLNARLFPKWHVALQPVRVHVPMLESWNSSWALSSVISLRGKWAQYVIMSRTITVWLLMGIGPNSWEKKVIFILEVSQNRGFLFCST